jgi:hypothetical protein
MKRSAVSTADDPPVVKNAWPRSPGIPRRVVGELHRLVVERARQLLAAVTDIHAPHAGRAVDQGAPFAIDDVDAVAAPDKAARLVTHRLGDRPGLQEMAARGLDRRSTRVPRASR